MGGLGSHGRDQQPGLRDSRAPAYPRMLGWSSPVPEPLWASTSCSAGRDGQVRDPRTEQQLDSKLRLWLTPSRRPLMPLAHLAAAPFPAEIAPLAPLLKMSLPVVCSASKGKLSSVLCLPTGGCGPWPHAHPSCLVPNTAQLNCWHAAQRVNYPLYLLAEHRGARGDPQSVGKIKPWAWGSGRLPGGREI